MKSREHVTTNGRAVFYAAMWNDLRQAALDKGWALALHGSLASDMDIMAMPWTECATNPDEMIKALRECFTDCEDITVSKNEMPNNRMVYTLSVWADFYLDINIMRVNKDESSNTAEEHTENVCKCGISKDQHSTEGMLCPLRLGSFEPQTCRDA